MDASEPLGLEISSLHAPLFSLCTTCKGRLEHLKRTIQSSLSHTNVEVILLDYSCPEESGMWAAREYAHECASQRLRIIYAPNREFYHSSHAKNITHTRARGNILVNADADNYIDDAYLRELDRLFRDSSVDVVRPAEWNSATATSGMMGRIAIRREAYFTLGGYDEDYFGWGDDDTDLIRRAMALGLCVREIAHSKLNVIEHDDSLRILNAPFTSKNESARRNEAIGQHNLRMGNLIANRSRIFGLLE